MFHSIEGVTVLRPDMFNLQWVSHTKYRKYSIVIATCLHDGHRKNLTFSDFKSPWSEKSELAPRNQLIWGPNVWSACWLVPNGSLKFGRFGSVGKKIWVWLYLKPSVILLLQRSKTQNFFPTLPNLPNFNDPLGTSQQAGHTFGPQISWFLGANSLFLTSNLPLTSEVQNSKFFPYTSKVTKLWWHLGGPTPGWPPIWTPNQLIWGGQLTFSDLKPPESEKVNWPPEISCFGVQMGPQPGVGPPRGHWSFVTFGV